MSMVRFGACTAPSNPVKGRNRPGQNNFGFLNEFLDYHLLNYIDDGVELILYSQMGCAPLQIRVVGRLVVGTLVGA
jgi:hypothetical protein